MNKHSVFIRFYLPEYDTTSHKDLEMHGESSMGVAKKVKELHKDREILHIEVANMEEDVPECFYDGKTLELISI